MKGVCWILHRRKDGKRHEMIKPVGVSSKNKLVYGRQIYYIVNVHVADRLERINQQNKHDTPFRKVLVLNDIMRQAKQPYL